MRFLCPERELYALQKIYMYNLLVIQVYCAVLHRVSDSLCYSRSRFQGQLFVSDCLTAFKVCKLKTRQVRYYLVNCLIAN